jgi:outer membrane receptor protein involved in Fe transport
VVATQPIVVTVTRSRTGLEELPVSASVLTREQIESSPAGTPDELLRTVPGVQLPLSNSNANFPVNPSVSIRGVGLGDNGTRTLVLLDGLPMNGAFFGNVFWNQVTVGQLERVEVVRGGASSLFGSYGLGGVVSLFTRPLAEQPRLEVGARGGSFDTVSTELHAGGGRGPVRGRIDGAYFDTDGFTEVERSQRGPLDQPTSAENGVLHGRVEADLGERVTAFVTGQLFDQDQGGTTPIARTDTRLHGVAAGAFADLGAGGVLDGKLFYRDESFRTWNPTTDAARASEFLAFRSDSDADDLGGSLVWSLEREHWLARLSLGLDGRLVLGENDAQTFRPDGTLFLDERTEGRQESVGLFGEALLEPHPRLDVLVSLRGDFFENTDGERRENGVDGDLPSRSFEAFSYRVATRFDVTEALALRGAAYRAFRAPTLAELYRSFGTSRFRGLANPELREETLDGGELGADLALWQGRARLGVTAFYNEVDDFVGGVPVAFFPVFTLENQNLGETRSRGIEAIAEVQVHDRVTLSASYAFTDAEITDSQRDSGLEGNRVEGVPRHTVTAGVAVEPYTGVRLTVRGRYLSDQFQDAGNETRLGELVVFDAAATWDLPGRGPLGGAQLYVAAENLLDEDYEASAFGGLVQRGTPASVTGGVTLRF